MTARLNTTERRVRSKSLEQRFSIFALWIYGYSLVAVIVSVVGCKVGPDFSKPQTPVPPMWQSTQGHVGIGSIGETASELAWWQTLNSPELDRIVYTLEQQNFSLHEAAERINEARAQKRATATQRMPTFSGDAAYSYRRFSQNGNAFVPQANSTSGFNFLDTGIDLAWELDVWGRVKRLEEAAQADIDRSSELYRDLRVMLIAEACRTFVEARVLQHRLLVAEANLEIQRQTLALTETRWQAGLASELDVLQSKTQLELTEATVPNLEAQLYAAIFRLCILQGTPPIRDPWVIVGEGDIPILPCNVAIGIPCDLLRQRPDVRAAEEKLKADSARVGVAIADLYPQLSINGNVSVNSRVGSTLFTQGSLAHDIGPSVKWNIFQMGRTRASIAAARFRYEQSVAGYQQAVLEAYEEVENALVKLDTAQRAEARFEAAVFNARRAYEVAVSEYGRGVLAFQTVLDTERQLLSAQDEWAQSRGASVQALVDLYRAMGGGWMPEAWYCTQAETPANEYLEGTVDPNAAAPSVVEPLPPSDIQAPNAPEQTLAPTLIEPLPIDQIPSTTIELLPRVQEQPVIEEPMQEPQPEPVTQPLIEPMPAPVQPIIETAPQLPADVQTQIAPEAPTIHAAPGDLFTVSEPMIVRLPQFTVKPLNLGVNTDSSMTLTPSSESLSSVFRAPLVPEVPVTELEPATPAPSVDAGIGTIQFVPVPNWAIEQRSTPTTTVSQPVAEIEAAPEPATQTNPRIDVESDESSEASSPATSSVAQTLESEVSVEAAQEKSDEYDPRVARIAPLPLDTNFAPNQRYASPVGSGLAGPAEVSETEAEPMTDSALAPAVPQINESLPQSDEATQTETVVTERPSLGEMLPSMSLNTNPTSPELSFEMEQPAATPSPSTLAPSSSEPTIRMASPLTQRNTAQGQAAQESESSAIVNEAAPRIANLPFKPIAEQNVTPPAAAVLAPQPIESSVEPSTDKPAPRMVETSPQGARSPAEAGRPASNNSDQGVIRPAIEPPPRAFVPAAETSTAPRAAAPSLLDRSQGTWQPLEVASGSPIVVSRNRNEPTGMNPVNPSAEPRTLSPQTLARLPWKTTDATVQLAQPPVR